MSKFSKAQPWLGLLSRLILGGVLLIAGYLKVGATDKSQMAVRAYELLPISIANLFGLVLPFFEVAIGLLLILGAGTRIAAALGGFTMFIFIIAISQAWIRGISLDCGCFGKGGLIDSGELPVWNYTIEIGRDILLALTGAYMFRNPNGKFGLDKSDNSSSQVTGEFNG